MKQVIVVRTGIEISKGQIVRQTARAALGAIQLLNAQQDEIISWLKSGSKTEARAAEGKAILEIMVRAKKAGLPLCAIADSGDQLPRGTVICLAIGPADDAEIDKTTGELEHLL